MNSSYDHPIRVLSPQLANQIAAGEVVERPASVVKELVENSLDAGATQIYIEIEQGGQKRILIRDNGKGIVKDELILALSRHATSKIADIDDLEHITSMGFRGEALASISSVSRLTLTSKPVAQNEAWQAIAEGRDMQVEITPAAHPDGTSIEVLDLFFNTPARRKFLRTGKTEFQHIEQILKRLALTRVDVQFELVHNQKTVFKYLAGKALAQRIEQVCGKQMLLNSTAVDYYYEGVKLSGWCSQLGAGVATRDLQYTFVNGRMMKDKLLTHALRQVYEETLAPQSFPCYVLYLQVPPEQLDVNVHPAKHEVRFHQARKVHDLVFKAVNDAITAGLLHDENKNSEDSRARNNAESPNHGYIQALKTDKAATAQLSSASKSSNAYQRRYFQPDKASQGQIKAAHELYQSSDFSGANKQDALLSLGKGSLDNAQSDVSEQINQAANSDDTQFEQTENLTQFMLAMPYIVFSGNACTGVVSENTPLVILPIISLVIQVIDSRLNKSTMSQPLLMPVSTQIDSADVANICESEWLSQQGFKLRKTNMKLILQQVPSELRQLPWAAMFSQIAGELTQIKSRAELLNIIAKSWLQHSHLNSSMLQGWINEIGVNILNKLIKQEAKTLPLAHWMQQHEA